MHTDVTSLLFEAANLLVVGMVVVFLFLSLLIGAITAIAWLCGKFPQEDETPQAGLVTKSGVSGVHQGDIPQPVIAAITAAISQYRNQR
ncbi:MAG: oxaloacetate decarboxylase gamma subunit [Paraglaciecola sp.]|jgi:oxaloacetate decarboxylase gamma subunit